MSTSKQVLQIISQIVQKDVSDSEELLSSGLIDSVSVMDLVVAIKETFHVEIPFEEIVEIMSNSSTIIEYVEKHKK
jgi:conserved domain protein